MFGIAGACNKIKEKKLHDGAHDRHYLTLRVLRGAQESAFTVNLKRQMENFCRKFLAVNEPVPLR